MTQRFSLLQLFSTIDGRNIVLSLQEECEMLSSITKYNVTKANLLEVKEFIKTAGLYWYKTLYLKFLEFGITQDTPLNECLTIITEVNKTINISLFTYKQTEELGEYLKNLEHERSKATAIMV